MACTDHDHTVPKFTPTSEENNLVEFIDVANVKILNSFIKPNGKSKEDFLNLSLPENNEKITLESDCDNQILLIIPFLTNVTLYSILLETKDSEGTLKHLNLFNNLNESFNDFNSVSRREPDQSTEIIHNSTTVPEYPLDRVRIFKNCNKLHIFLPDNMEDDEDLITRITYLEIRGEPSNKKTNNGLDANLTTKVFLKDATFESLGNPKDHKKVEQNNSAIMEL